MLTTPRVLPLADCGPDQTNLVGGKATGLAGLIRHGLPVPGGFVITTDAYRDCLRAAGLADRIAALIPIDTAPEVLRSASAAIRELFADRMLSEAVAAEIEAGYRALGTDVPVAVRSSATAEDTATASFAGQQDTYLWVRGIAEVRRQVVSCWASLFTPQAIGYRARFAIDPEDLAMAVVVQRMVPADVAGVMMTIDPVTGDRATIYISAAYGLGEGVVKGDVGADSYWTDKPTLAVRRRELAQKAHAYRFSPEQDAVIRADVAASDQEVAALSDDQVAALAEIGRRVEEAQGRAQDLEWAIADGEIALLQARPETVWSQRGTVECASGPEVERSGAAAEPEPFSILHSFTSPEATWSTTNVGESIPGVPSPLGWSIWRPAGELAVRRTFASIGALSSAEAALPVTEDGWLIGIFYGHPSIRVDLLCTWAERVPGTDPVAMSEQTFSAVPAGYVSRAQYRHYPRVLARAPMPFITGPKLIREDHRRMENFHTEAIAAIATADENGCRSWLGRGIDAWMESLYRQTLVTMGAVQPVSDQLLKLADSVGISGQELMAGYGGHEETRVVVDAWACSRGKLDQDTFVQRHGYHGWHSGELSSTAWREDRAPVEDLIARYAAKSAGADPEIAERERVRNRHQLEATLLGELSPVRRPAGRAVLALAARYVPLRGVGKVSFLRGVDVARAAARRLGEMYAADGRLDDPEDVFYLSREEIFGRWPGDVRERIAARRALRERFSVVEIPQTFAGVPTLETIAVETGADLVTGTPASPGTVEGRARVVTRPEDAHVEEGEILVAHDTDPGWASLMFLSAGLIADIGGIMSHTAVVARELAIPCVVNAKHATHSIRTGDLLRLDGSSGQITIVRRAAAEE